MKSVYCAVRTGSLYESQHFVFKWLKYINEHNSICNQPDTTVCYFTVTLLLASSVGLKRPQSGQYLQQQKKLKMPVHIAQRRQFYGIPLTFISILYNYELNYK